MNASYDERHWYGRMGWPHLRRLIMQVAIDVFNDIEPTRSIDDSDPTVFPRQLVASVMALMEERREAETKAMRAGWVSSEHTYSSSKWNYALALFGETETLVKALVRDRQIFLGRSNRDIVPTRALGEIMRQFLEEARRKQSPATEHRQKTWEAISRVSSQVIAELGPGVRVDRYSNQHISDVQQKLVELYPTSKNLGLKDVDTVRSYFYEFCEECQQGFSADWEKMEDSQSAILNEELDRKARIEHCLLGLQKTDPQSWETMIIKYEFDELPKSTVQDFVAARGLTRHKFEKLLSQAIEFMRDCFESTMKPKFGRGQ